MEMLVVIAIIMILAAIALPVIAHVKSNSYKTKALHIMHQLAAQIAPYAADNDGNIPAEDVAGKDSWKEAGEPGADSAWYNALPRRMREKGLGDFVKEGRTEAFYTTENFLFLPGADYPHGKKLEKPWFAIAMNTKLQRKTDGHDGTEAKKPPVKFASIILQGRTVAFLEQGLPGESRAHPTISAKNDYDGSPKGSAKSFVARYTGKGVIAFMDGTAVEVSGNDLLSASGKIRWEADWHTTNPSAIYWTPDPKDDPN